MYRSFVSPHLCHKLKIAGIEAATPIFWEVNNCEAFLKSYFFDADNYYKNADELINTCKPPLEILNAYQLTDMELLLPKYLLINDVEGGYSLMLDDMYHTKSIKDTRLADLFAKMVLECIANKILISENAVTRLQSLFTS